jgi:predicted kinase
VVADPPSYDDLSERRCVAFVAKGIGGQGGSVDVESAFAARMEEIHVFERTWWLRPTGNHVGFLDRHPGKRVSLLARLAEDLPVHTEHVYLDAPEEWHEERLAVQRSILSDLVPADPDSDSVDREAQSEGAVYFLIGLPGSGKTTALRPVVAAHAGVDLESLMTSDADEVRTRFPEYEGGLGSGVVQTETVDVTYGGRNVALPVQQAVLARRGVSVVDVIGDPKYLPPTIQELAARGRPCFVLLTRCPVATCEERAVRRAVEQGRLVPSNLIAQKEGVPEDALRVALETGGVSGWAIVDTSAPSPQLVDGDGTFSL